MGSCPSSCVTDLVDSTPSHVDVQFLLSKLMVIMIEMLHTYLAYYSSCIMHEFIPQYKITSYFRFW